MAKEVKTKKLPKSKIGIRLDIGCGANKQGEDWVGIDYRKLPSVDIVHNLEKFPWPIENNSVLVAICSHVVEHIDPHGGVFINFMDEIWRILKPGGQLAIATPYAGSPGYYQDPTHCNPCNELTFSYFDPEDTLTAGQLYNIYRPKPWKIESRIWHKNGNLEIVMSKRPESSKHA